MATGIFETFVRFYGLKVISQRGVTRDLLSYFLSHSLLVNCQFQVLIECLTLYHIMTTFDALEDKAF